MNIRKCYVENFGKLHHFDYEFSEGLNVINEMNGWGKSTFATFIKVMFFGFDSSNKRSVLENERKKYFPWQGGKFGGKLEFEIDCRVYEIERFFGMKDKDDTFKLYNKLTNCESTDFSSNIGEEIFGIDKQAYERSTYIPQQDIDVEINDSLSAKLSNILEGESDINSSDEAINRIVMAMKELKKTGNRGRLNELETQIFAKKRELEKAYKNEELIEDRNNKIGEIKKQIKQLEEALKENQGKLNLISENEKNKMRLDRYKEICDLIKKDELEINELMNFFGEGIPSDSDIDRYEELVYELDTVYAKMGELKISDEDIASFENLKQFFSGKNISDDMLNGFVAKVNELEDLKNELNILNEKFEAEKRVYNIETERVLEQKKLKKNKAILSVLVILSGIAFGIFVNKFLYLVSLLGVIYLVFNIIDKKKESGLNESVLNDLKLKIDNNTEKIAGYEKELDGFVNSFGVLNTGYYDFMNRIRENYSLFKKLSLEFDEKKRRRAENENIINEIVDVMCKNLSHYLDVQINTNDIKDFSGNCKDIIFAIKNNKIRLENLRAKLKNDIELKEKYETEYEINKISVNEELLGLRSEELIKKNDLISSEISRLVNQRSYDENEMNRLINTSMTVDEIELEIENMETELMELKDRYSVLDKTQKYLSKAKEEFSSHYLGNMINGFEKYIGIINGDSINSNIDVNLNVKIEEYGEKKEIDYLSTGYRDLIGICMRLALIDALFEGEKPFIILDDPFVNLDEDKLNSATDLLKQLSSDYQIIYFVCHESRNID